MIKTWPQHIETGIHKHVSNHQEGEVPQALSRRSGVEENPSTGEAEKFL